MQSQRSDNTPRAKARGKAGAALWLSLMHNSEVVGIYDDHSAAYWVGCERYELGNFSLEWIGARPAQLGIITTAA